MDFFLSLHTSNEFISGEKHLQYCLDYNVMCRAITLISLLAYVNKANFWVDSWHPYLFISRNFTDQEKNGCQFFH